MSIHFKPISFSEQGLDMMSPFIILFDIFQEQSRLVA